MTVRDTNNVVIHEGVPVSLTAGTATRVDFPGGQLMSLNFYQISATIDENSNQNSRWGEVAISLPAGNSVRYFNLSVNEQWVLQNVPLTATDDTDIVHAAFDLGVQSGTPFSRLDFSACLATETKSSKPDFELIAPVESLQHIFNSGLYEFNAEFNAPLASIIGGESSDSASHSGDFPNQECGKNECAPAAASNSIKFLDANSEQDLSGFDDIDTMKNAMNFNNGVAADWYNAKDQYMQEDEHPITTTHTTDSDVAIQAIKDGKDVEITGGWHVAAVVGITKTSDGKYEIEVVHDKKQGESGGLTKETITYDPGTGKISGSPGFFDGGIFRHFTI